MSIIFHIDVNSAFLSWTAIERLKTDPSLDLRTIPSIIGGDKKSRHGIVLAKSIPAKKFGIRTAEPVASAFRKCPTLHMEPPDHKLYHRRSQEMMQLLHSYTPDIEQVSIDECYLDFTPIAHLFPSAREAAKEISGRIRTELGFTVNIGIAPNKLLAKMASDFEKPDKIHTLYPEEIPSKMWPLPVGELFMVGHASAERLIQLGIRTIGDLAHADPDFLQVHFKSHGLSMWEHANGIDTTPLDSEEHDLKGIGNSTTLSHDLKSADDAKKILLQLSEQVAGRLRRAHQIAQTVTVEIKYHTFQSCSRQMQLSVPAGTTDTVYRCACQLFDELWNGTPIRLLGIRTTKLLAEDTPVQLSLFDFGIQEIPDETEASGKTSTIPSGNPDQAVISGSTNSDRRPQTFLTESLSRSKDTVFSDGPQTATPSLERQKRLDEAMDQIRKRFGNDAVIRGTFLTPKTDSTSQKKNKH
ncbi:MAG: DNA polymerase IV [Lachnospiraceae bacterium]|nr:DNA polymerase IV [Lachnospiraceae bacterium]